MLSESVKICSILGDGEALLQRQVVFEQIPEGSEGAKPEITSEKSIPSRGNSCKG